MIAKIQMDVREFGVFEQIFIATGKRNRRDGKFDVFSP
jgi:hypothetical protein